MEARQADAVDMARLLCMPTRYVSAPAQGAELTYANLADVRRDLIESGGLSHLFTVISKGYHAGLYAAALRLSSTQYFFAQVVEEPSTPGGQVVPTVPPLSLAAHRSPPATSPRYTT